MPRLHSAVVDFVQHQSKVLTSHLAGREEGVKEWEGGRGRSHLAHTALALWSCFAMPRHITTPSSCRLSVSPLAL